MLKNWKVQEIGGAVALLICGLVLLLMPELTLVTIANVIGILAVSYTHLTLPTILLV